ncbi:MAG: N-6 DNA methylase, partial [Thermoplasmata archaeon]|nr:N-6 DNA methylase [Thermoplasmata archaeon]
MKKEIRNLIEKYKRERDEREARGERMGDISEADVRANYIDPLFEILGWDIHNVDEYNREHYVRERGFADIALLIKNKPVAFVEAKRFGSIPDVNREEKDWIIEERQVLNYAADRKRKIKWAILTNFERTRVFNALNGKLVLSFETVFDYLDRFEQLLLLSKESFITGRIDRFERHEERPDIDLRFLKKMNGWRLRLARDIYHNNFANEEGFKREIEEKIREYEKIADEKLRKHLIRVARGELEEVDYDLLKDEEGGLDMGALKSAVQRILDRLLIIRYSEDRMILENPDQLLSLYESWMATKKYTSLMKLLGDFFRGFDKQHNSSIFTEGHVCERVKISDEVIGQIIEEMYEVNFRRFDFDILGNTYETYLGTTLALEGGKIVLKPTQEKRKKSGIYYTPPYIVDYIVKNTLGEILKGKSVEEVRNIRVLDPACGSGSFLIKAYDHLSRFYEEENERIRQRKDELARKIRESGNGVTEYKALEGLKEIRDYEKSILENNIFGVDLDEQAAEIASVNLVLKAIGGGGTLPLILGQTVKVGNSLISGTEDELRKYFGDNWKEKRPFNWEEEFPEVFQRENPGFDVIIGNPPYEVFSPKEREDEDTKKDIKYIKETYKFQRGKINTYRCFLEKSLTLLRKGGVLGFIIPSTILCDEQAESI